ncbi:unnamed protein product [Adineta steineri]|uniref:Uncharacterized protein n=1 Tax=Adineta steineri TaxID=433720 RepID=A0A814N174_9BILA|nr:unnamed protein product [Adineta steineri]CAF1175358.1 unnamed protein product [Adineta steineri]
MAPVMIPVNQSTAINIEVRDTDGDTIRCRWAMNSSTVNECGEACAPVSLAKNTTIYPNCTIIITGESIDDWYAVTVIVEDFIDSFSNTPLSSVPIQFLVHVVVPSTNLSQTTPSETINWPIFGTVTSLALLTILALSCCSMWYSSSSNQQQTKMHRIVSH